jgi:hypothetical protein
MSTNAAPSTHTPATSDDSGPLAEVVRGERVEMAAGERSHFPTSSSPTTFAKRRCTTPHNSAQRKKRPPWRRPQTRRTAVASNRSRRSTVGCSCLPVHVRAIGRSDHRGTCPPALVAVPRDRTTRTPALGNRLGNPRLCRTRPVGPRNSFSGFCGAAGDGDEVPRFLRGCRCWRRRGKSARRFMG